MPSLLVKKNARRKPPSHSPYHAPPLRERMEGSAVFSRYCRTLWRRGDQSKSAGKMVPAFPSMRKRYSPTEAPTDYHVNRSLKD
uniref:Uncharacterized protein n=1 Tax=Ditylenchus dipsaci TaxID=166011 RepID=A0A915E4N7_9BILA